MTDIWFVGRVFTGLFFYGISTFIVGAQSGYLPIYSDPMVFLDQTGKEVGTLPPGFKILNTKKGDHDSGWSQGMAGTSVSDSTLIPAYNYDTRETVLFDYAGKRVVSLGTEFVAVTPCYEGFFLARKIVKGKYFNEDVFYFLDQSGRRVFSTAGYSKASIFHDGMAAVKSSAGWRYLDKEGIEHNLIDPALKNVYEVSPFYSGLSRLTIGPGRRCGYTTCFDFLFIDKEGRQVIDTRVLFPNDTIYDVSDFHQGIAVVSFTSKFPTSTANKACINTKGEVVLRIKNATRMPDFENGYAVINTDKVVNGRNAPDSAYLLTPGMKKIIFAPGKGYTYAEGYDLENGFFEVVYVADKIVTSKIYDAHTGKFFPTEKANVMGVNGDLLSYKNSMEERFYVKSLRTGNIVYDTKASNRLFSNIKSALDFSIEATRYSCHDKADIPYLPQLVFLKELTFNRLDITSIPPDINPLDLETLRLDGLMQLEAFPMHIKGLKKISLRDCVKANNLFDFLKQHPGLKELYLVNFDITEEQEKSIRAMFPQAKIIISGSAKLAHSEIQEYIDGF